MKGFSAGLAAVLSFALAVPVFGGVGSDIPDNGQHFNLNIIGVPKGKKVDMTDSQRHTIFVPLNTSGYIDGKVKISYVRNTANPNSFEVLDGNATDANGAIIAVPYEYCTDLETGCTELLSYNVYAVALGKPGAVGAVVEAHCTYDTNVVDTNGTAGLTCEDTLLLGGFDLKRESGSPKPVDITNIFRATGCLDLNASSICDSGDLAFSNIWIFNIPNLTDYFWDYTNDGLKLMQVRFYPTTSGSIGYVK
jgi:hypothetical protein